jgi:hypothetical protein
MCLVDFTSIRASKRNIETAGAKGKGKIGQRLETLFALWPMRGDTVHNVQFYPQKNLTKMYMWDIFLGKARIFWLP